MMGMGCFYSAAQALAVDGAIEKDLVSAREIKIESLEVSIVGLGAIYRQATLVLPRRNSEVLAK